MHVILFTFMLKEFTHTRSISGAEEYRLTTNDLRVLVIPRRDVPVAGVMVTYHVGSRNEVPGTTGATHILEHLMFKGSTHFDPRKGRGTAEIIESTGALMNATTWNDRTNYYEVSETRHVGDILALEADRMRNLLLREDDLAAEMVVVRNEYERWKNDPIQQLSARLWDTAFHTHPYHYPTIGTKEDIEGTNVVELREFYDTFYWPNNATVTIAGDVSAEEALPLVLRAFAHIPKGELPKHNIPTEPLQTKENRLDYERTGTVHALGVAYKTPEGMHVDSPALAVLTALLSDGKGSMLSQTFVDASHATSLHGMLSRFHDPGLLEFEILLTENTQHADALALFDSVVVNLKNSIPDADFLRARVFAGAQALYHRAALSDFINSLNESLALGDWADVYSFAERMHEVSKEDVLRVARIYLIPEGRTVANLIAT